MSHDLPLTRAFARPLPARRERFSRALAGLLGVALLTGPAFAQAPAPDACAAFNWSVAEAKAAMAGTIPQVASGPTTARDFELKLAPTEDVSFPIKPERTPKKPGTFGGFITLDPPPGKLFQVTLSDEAWIDVVQNGRYVKSSSFSGQHGCNGVRKSVRFVLPGVGPVTVQVSGADAGAIKVDVRGVE